MEDTSEFLLVLALVALSWGCWLETLTSEGEKKFLFLFRPVASFTPKPDVREHVEGQPGPQTVQGYPGQPTNILCQTVQKGLRLGLGGRVLARVSTSPWVQLPVVADQSVSQSINQMRKIPSYPWLFWHLH